MTPVENEVCPGWRSAEDYSPPFLRDAGDAFRDEDVFGSTQLEYICEHIVYQATDWCITGEDMLSLAFEDGKIL